MKYLSKSRTSFVGAVLIALAVGFGWVGGPDAIGYQNDSNGNLWLNYVGDHPLGSGPWGLHLEVQNRRADEGGSWQQLLVRPGINYQINPDLSVSAGWAYVKTWPYGDFPAVHDFPEHRAWQQVAWKTRAAGLEWLQRFRLEQRWIGEMKNVGGDWDVANWRYQNRFRYMLRTTIPLCERGRTYLVLWDEVFLNFGGNISPSTNDGRNVFDQNRAFVGVGRKLSEHSRIEVGFMEQTVMQRKNPVVENNHTVTVWFTSNLPFWK